MIPRFNPYTRIWPDEINDNRLALCATKAKMLEYTAKMNYEPEPVPEIKPRKIKPFFVGEKKSQELKVPDFVKLKKAGEDTLEYLKKIRV